MKKTRKPRTFIVSATESQDVVEVLSECLNKVSDVVPWHLPSNWAVGTFVLENLLEHARRYDFAIIVFGVTDKVISRKQQSYAPRDNVIFEAGLFMAHLGRHRTFIVAPKAKGLKVLSDLAGLALLTYEKPSPKTGLVGAMSPICTRIKAEIKQRGIRRSELVARRGPEGFTEAHARFKEYLSTRGAGKNGTKVLNIALDMEHTWGFLRDNILDGSSYENLTWRSLMLDGEASASLGLRGYVVTAKRAAENAAYIQSFCRDRAQALEGRRIGLEVRAYASEPILHGFLLNQEILTLALCWKKEQELRSSPYLLFDQNPEDLEVDPAMAQEYISFFEGWFREEWGKARPIWPV
jgi:hypothetical protein